MTSFGRQPVNAAYSAEIDIAKEVFRNAADVVAGQSVGNCVTAEDGMLGRRVVQAAQPGNARSDPKPAFAVDIETGNRSTGSSGSNRKRRELPVANRDNPPSQSQTIDCRFVFGESRNVSIGHQAILPKKLLKLSGRALPSH